MTVARKNSLEKVSLEKKEHLTSVCSEKVGLVRPEKRKGRIFWSRKEETSLALGQKRPQITDLVKRDLGGVSPLKMPYLSRREDVGGCLQMHLSKGNSDVTSG